MAWVKNNFVLLSSALVLLILFIVLFVRAFKRTPVIAGNNDEATKAVAN